MKLPEYTVICQSVIVQPIGRTPPEHLPVLAAAIVATYCEHFVPMTKLAIFFAPNADNFDRYLFASHLQDCMGHPVVVAISDRYGASTYLFGCGIDTNPALAFVTQ
jgi:hypothetical protein